MHILHAEDYTDKQYIIGPEDILEIKVWDNEDLNCTVEIPNEGFFTFSLIGRVRASGLSISELEKYIEKELADGYLVSPQVTIGVKEYRSQKVFVLGEVVKPGSYALKGNPSIIELISQAGGFTDKGGRIVTIVRPNKLAQRAGNAPSSIQDKDNEVITLNIGEFRDDNAYHNFRIMDGDSIYINPSPRIFVTGEVKNPGEVKWEKGLTVRQAVSLAGGPTEKASPKRVITIRTRNGVENELKSKMDDMVIPGDIIKVPGRYF